VLVGLHTGDDSGVYRLSGDLALVQTVDFITPVVDDPYLFGQIAAANSLSDVYAMGGEVLTAMNVLLVPEKGLDPGRIGDILRGGADKVREAGGSLVGGHTIRNPELVYGLSVTGRVHPDRILANAGAVVGDVLVLTKPLGTGLVNTLVKFGKATRAQEEAVGETMARLNRVAASHLTAHEAHAVTDVTGFGLVGHAAGIARESRVNLYLRFSAIPLLDGAMEAAGKPRMIPAGTRRNLEAFACRLDVEAPDEERALTLLCDPQTSGGLLVALPAERAAGYLSALAADGVAATIIGEVAPPSEGGGRLVILP